MGNLCDLWVDFDHFHVPVRIPNFDEAGHRVATAADEHHFGILAALILQGDKIGGDLLVAVDEKCWVVECDVAVKQLIKRQSTDTVALDLSFFVATRIKPVVPNRQYARNRDDRYGNDGEELVADLPQISEQQSHREQDDRDRQHDRSRTNPLDEYEACQENAEDGACSRNRVEPSHNVAGP